MTDWNALLTEIGVNVERHDQLIESQNALFEQTFPVRKNRPGAMKIFDRAFHESHFERVRNIIEHRKNGGKSIGTFCIYVPDEIALALGVIPIPLCGGAAWSIPWADKALPRDICPIIRSTFGMALSGTCPYKNIKDLVVGETTCDAKKKAWDLFGFFVMEVPQKKKECDLNLWKEEVREFARKMEEISGATLNLDSLRSAVHLCNERRRLLREINAFRKDDNPPLSGLDALLVSQTALAMDAAQFVDGAGRLLEELCERRAQGIGAYDQPGSRALVAGTPSPMGFAKIHAIVESAGLRIVADESCTGSRYFLNDVEESLRSLDSLMDSIAERYFKIDCSCFSPNHERMDNVMNIMEEYRVEGVIQFILQYCHGYNVEARKLDKVLQKKGVPAITIETDYSSEDAGQLRTRVEAFAELLNTRART